MQRQKRRFQLYRYQILPISRFQLDLFGSRDMASALAEKNALFMAALLGVDEFDHNRGDIAHKVLHSDSRIAIVRVGVNRGLTRETREFVEEEVEDWPSAIVVFDNDPAQQKIAIEVNPRAFKHAITLAHIIKNAVNIALAEAGLTCEIEPIFDKQNFWDVVKRYTGRIVAAEFRMVAPNMSNISSTLKVDLRDWARVSNMNTAIVALKSDKNSSLSLNEGDEPVSSFVDYSSQGGGNVSLSVKNFRIVRTEEHVREMTIDAIDMTADSDAAIAQMAAMFTGLLEK